MTNNKNLGSKLFTMVVVADTHLSEKDMESNSPFPVNRLANGRMKHVVQDINAINPDFVINLGDLIHPVPGVPHAYKEAVERFLEQTSKLTCDQHLVPGNHDVGDKPIDWAPAGVVCDDYLALWETYFGEHYYAFEKAGCHFIVINAQIINTGLEAEQAQREWLENYLAQHRGARFFFNIHYPPFLTEKDEPEHYDNIAEPGRSWLLDLMETHSVEALFAGHVHNFWFNRYADTDCYLLPSTAFVRQDYSEMYRVPPEEGEEHGRNEAAKLGYFKVNVYENGHVCHIVRTYGQLAEQGDTVVPPKVDAVHPAEHSYAPLGFDLRQTWSEVLEIPPSGGLDEFIRKPVRNDYPLMALWEMGVKKLRVPLHDLQDTYVRERMKVLIEHGQEFTVFSFGLLTDAERQTLLEHQDLVSSWELAFAWQDLSKIASQQRSLKDELDLPVYLSRLRTHDDAWESGDRYFHVINHGFSMDDREKMEMVLDAQEFRDLIAGFVLRMAWRDEPASFIRSAGALCDELGVKASVHVRLADENPAEANYDDLANANRIAATLASTLTQPNLDTFVDTFADNDRGYFVKNGVVDRRYNPRIGSQIVRNLYAEFNGVEGLKQLETTSLTHGVVHQFGAGNRSFALVLPEAPFYLSQIKVNAAPGMASVRHVNLETGIVQTAASEIDANVLKLDDAALYQVPTLISWTLAE